MTRLLFLHQLSYCLLHCQPLSNNEDECSCKMGIVGAETSCSSSEGSSVMVHIPDRSPSSVSIARALQLMKTLWYFVNVVCHQSLQCMKHYRPSHTKVTVRLHGFFLPHHYASSSLGSCGKLLANEAMSWQVALYPHCP